MRRALLLVAAAVPLAGCLGDAYGRSGYELAPLPPLPGAAPPGPNYGTAGGGVAMRQFAGPATYLAPMPTAVVILRRDQRERNANFCSYFIQEEQAWAAMQAAGAKADNIVLTRWPLATPDLEANPQDCTRMIAGYDFARAEALLGSFAKAEGAADPGTRGPYILQIMPNGAAILVDGSAVNEGSEMRAWTIGWLGIARAQAASATTPPPKPQTTGPQTNPGPGQPPGSRQGATTNPGPGTTTPAQPGAGETAGKQDQQPWWNRMRDGLVGVVEEHVPYGKVIIGSIRWLVGPGEAAA